MDDLIVIILALGDTPLWVAFAFLAVAAVGIGVLIWDAVAD